MISDDLGRGGGRPESLPCYARGFGATLDLTDVFVQIVPVVGIIDFHVAQSVVAEPAGRRRHVLGRMVFSAARLVRPTRHRVHIAANIIYNGYKLLLLIIIL